MNLKNITKFLIKILPEQPKSAVILGSGLGNFVDFLENSITIPYADIPDFPLSTVAGHAGEWVFGYCRGKPIICAKGRFHYYEGLSMDNVALPVTVIHQLGCKSIFITNAAGCLNKNWELGDFMLIKGYLDYTFRGNSNPPSISSINTSPELLLKVKKTASELGILLREGIYTWTLGPSYETPAEIKDIIKLGGNAVGMSTVPEIMKANELGLNLIGISCLTNYGAGLVNAPLSHEDVLENSKRFQKEFSKLLIEIV